MDMNDTLMLILSELKDIKSDISELKQDVKELKQGQFETKQNLATVLEVVNGTNENIAALENQNKELPGLTDKNICDIARLQLKMAK